MYKHKILSRKYGMGVWADYSLGVYFVFDRLGEFVFKLSFKGKKMESVYKKLDSRLFNLFNKEIFGKGK